MSRMGRAVLWVQENGLEDDLDALKKYLEYLDKKKESDARTENTESKTGEEVRDNS